MALDEKDWLACCGSLKFAQQMVSAGPFPNYQEALNAANDIWFNKVDVNGWLEAFAAHPQIGESPSKTHKSPTSAQWSKGEQSTALATANDSTLQGAIRMECSLQAEICVLFLIFASGRASPEILAEMKRRYQNRPIVELELAAQEQMKITELRLTKLFSADTTDGAHHQDSKYYRCGDESRSLEDRVSVIGGHLTAKPEAQVFTRTCPPITTHILDVARGAPAADVDVRLEMWGDDQSRPLFGQTTDSGFWKVVGCSITDKDGRSGPLMGLVGPLTPGVYRISFETGKYNPDGFFPFVTIVFEVRESQKLEHFHVPLLLSSFSFSTNRGS
ncbi:hypothetical protein CASFOL_004412 [Castilleja foliolosa]|uniref:Hydroxyisourate hydrolase n=1 Tax=Castilleja foliolosa TaxID=1961234 RepID=A0ABD3EAE8_9LAMI